MKSMSQYQYSLKIQAAKPKFLLNLLSFISLKSIPSYYILEFNLVTATATKSFSPVFFDF
jgi:hypothetical protein